MPLSRREVIRTATLGTGIVAVGNVSSLFTGWPAIAAPSRTGSASSSAPCVQIRRVCSICPSASGTG